MSDYENAYANGFQPFQKRLITLGQLVRIGAVSPPPPGSGPLYRSTAVAAVAAAAATGAGHCCFWPSTAPPTLSAVSLPPVSESVVAVARHRQRQQHQQRVRERHLREDPQSPSHNTECVSAAYSINSADIFSCVNRMRIAAYDDYDADATGVASATHIGATSDDLNEQHPVYAVRNHMLTTHSSSATLNRHLRQEGLNAPVYLHCYQYNRPCDHHLNGCDKCDDFARQQQHQHQSQKQQRPAAAVTLDRLPRFRFGGNRGATGVKLRDRERDKRDNEQRLRELSDRLKRNKTTTTAAATASFGPSATQTAPVPPPRANKQHVILHGAAPQVGAAVAGVQEDVVTKAVPNIRHAPARSVSFSQVDYSTSDKKYVRKLNPQRTNVGVSDTLKGVTLTLPRSKGSIARIASESSSHMPTIIVEPMSDRAASPLHIQAAVELEVNPISKQNCKQLCNIIPNPSEHVINECVKRDSANVEDSTSAQEKKRDKSRRRKGMYISQWPNDYQSPIEDDNAASTASIITVQPAHNTTHENEESISGKRYLSTEIPKLKINSIDKTEGTDAWRTPPQESLSPEDEYLLPCDWPQTSGSTQSDTNTADNSLKVTNSGAGSNSSSSLLLRADSLSEGEPDRSEIGTLIPSDVSDCEGKSNTSGHGDPLRHTRRYSKRPLRGPYGQMLEAEMKKPETKKKEYVNELKFLENLSTESTPPLALSSPVVGESKHVTRNRGASNQSLDEAQLKNNMMYATPVTTSSSPPTPSKHVIRRKASIDSATPKIEADAATSSMTNSKVVISHHRTTSSPSKLEGFLMPEAPADLLEQLLRGSSEQLAMEMNLQRLNDTRTHVVVELYDTEKSYVESLQILVTKYLEPLKSPENAGLLDAALVDEIFFQIPSLLSHHKMFLEELKKRLDSWDVKQKVGDILIDMFSNIAVTESYTNYVNNWKRAREIYKNAQQSKPAFARFLEAMAREHKGKLALDSLLIKPIQKFPKYELLLQRLIKHTDVSHPDHSLLLSAQREIHEQLLKINCTEREALELEQLREIESLIEGLMELVVSDRQYLRHDLVSMSAGASARKERALFLFSDLLLVTSIKRRSGTIRRPTTGTIQGSVTSALEANKYKLLMRISLDDLEIVRARDENLRQMMLEIENLTEDIAILNQINELTWTLHCSHTSLDDVLREMLANMNKQLVDEQNSDSQLSCLDLALNTANGVENVSVVFSKPDKRASWEETFNEAKHKLAISGDRRPSPELVATVPIRKTRAGLQFTCAAPTLHDGCRDVWVCNSDGYVGQVCILSLKPEPAVTSCNGICNARILCVASVPALSSSGSSSASYKELPKIDASAARSQHATIQFDSGSSSSDDDANDNDNEGEIGAADTINKVGIATSSLSKSRETISIDFDDSDGQQSTMWLGTEDGCIHVYNSSDNIRIKKNKIRLQHGSSILCIIYLENRVFVSLANGDIAIYDRDYGSGGWHTSSPIIITLGSSTYPVTKMLPNAGRLWCACGNTIKVLNTRSFVTDNSFAVNNDPNKPISTIVVSGFGVWLSLQNSAVIKCFHTGSFDFLCEVNVASAVTKMLTSCDDIIRQHKAACLRVTALLACKDLLWIGTSAGVLLTMPLPHITAGTSKLSSMPSVMGVPHGHTGHVRFLTHVDSVCGPNPSSPYFGDSTSGIGHQRHGAHFKVTKAEPKGAKVLIISGGDGYEDFRSTNLSEVAGREDSTNHLLLWHI